MMTLHQFSLHPKTIPMVTAWYLTDLAESRGKQELFTKQAPQKLKALREHALIESAISSNRIEGVLVEQQRVGTIIFGKPLLYDRDEEEVQGYRNALNLIHEQGKQLAISEETIQKLHRLIRGEIWDAGQYKEKDSDIIERYPDGRWRVRFKTVSAEQTPQYMRQWQSLWQECINERWVHPLIAMAGANLDFLCIHPFRDGNGRVSRLLLLLQCYHLGFDVGRYISLERLIEENKERYYETLEQSSYKWHEGKHDPWFFINFLLFILKNAYREFEEQMEKALPPKGAKTEMIIREINNTEGPFHIRDIQRACPGVSVDLIRRTLKKLRASGQVKCLERGQHARWQKVGKNEMGNT